MLFFHIHINSIKVKKSKQKLLVPTGKMRCFLNFEALVLFPKAEIKLSFKNSSDVNNSSVVLLINDKRYHPIFFYNDRFASSKDSNGHC